MSHGNYRLSYIIANRLYTYRHRAPYKNGLPNQMEGSLNVMELINSSTMCCNTMCSFARLSVTKWKTITLPQQGKRRA